MQGFKTGGRKRGIPNKITARLRSELSEHLETYIETQFKEDWNELTPRERVRIALSISQLLIPKPTPEPTESDEPMKPIEIRIVRPNGTTEDWTKRNKE